MVANIVLYKIGQVSLLFTHPNTSKNKKNIFFPVWLEIFKFLLCTLFWDQDSKAEIGSLKNKQSSQNSPLSRWKYSRLTSLEFLIPVMFIYWGVQSDNQWPIQTRSLQYHSQEELLCISNWNYGLSSAVVFWFVEEKKNEGRYWVTPVKKSNYRAGHSQASLKHVPTAF